MATPHFNWQTEIACKHCGLVRDVAVAEATAEWLETLREALGGRPIHVASWSRCAAHNQAVGGAAGSLHLEDLAVDIVVRGLSPYAVWRKCKVLQDQGLIGGLGRYNWGNHVDRGPRRNWDDR